MENAQQPYLSPQSQNPQGYVKTETSAGAIWSLVLGILGVATCLSPLTAIPGLICGFKSLGTINRSQGRIGGKGMAIAGIVLSFIGIFLILPIISILASASYPVMTKSIEKARMRKDAAHVDQIVKACKLYAMDHNGHYPTKVENAADRAAGLDFQTSTEAFNELIEKVDLGTEEIFYIQGNPMKLLPPNNDGVLMPEENSYIYVIGQTDSSPERSPLIADEMESPGVYGENHPWRRSGRVVVGYCGGQVKIEKLTSKGPGATVRGAPGSMIEDIFQQAEIDAAGRVTGGLLSVPTDHILLPE